MKSLFKRFSFLIVFYGVSCFAGSFEDFFAAIQRDDANTIASLLQRGFGPNSSDEKGQSGLILSLQKGSYRAAQVLVDSPATDVNALNGSNESPLMMVALKGEKAWAEQLVARGARLDLPGWSPLHYAACGPNSAVVDLLLARGAKMEARSPNGSTPLMMAAGYGSEESVKRLLDGGANAALTNDLGLRAADFARRTGRDMLAATLDRPLR